MSAVALASLVALRLDGPDGVCPAWMESADRRCGKAATVGLLCARHHKVAEARMVKQDAANARWVERRRAAAIERLPKAEAELARVERRLDVIDPARHERKGPETDPAMQNVALAKRMPSDARIQELARLFTMRGRLRSEVEGLRRGLAR